MLNSSAPSIILRPPSSQNVLSHGDVNPQSSYGPRQNNHERIEPTSYLTRFVQTRCFLFSKNLKNQNACQKILFNASSARFRRIGANVLLPRIMLGDIQ